MRTRLLCPVLLFIVVISSYAFPQGGMIDLSFQSEAFVNQVSCIAVQPDGKILIAGDFDSENELPVLIRLNADGSVGRSFNVDTKLWQHFLPVPTSISVQKDGKVVAFCVFPFRSCRGWNNNKILRFHKDGRVDQSFSIDENLSVGAGAKLTQLPDDGFMISQRVYYEISENESFEQLVKLDKNGNIDFNFRLPETWSDSNQVLGFGIDRDGNYYAPAYSENESDDLLISIICFDTKGKIKSASKLFDPEMPMRNVQFFSTGNQFILMNRFTTEDEIFALAIDRHGNQLGKFSIEPGPIPPKRFESPGYNLTVPLSDGRFILAGKYRELNGTLLPNLQIINKDGSIESSFQVDQELFNCAEDQRIKITACASDNDGNILVGYKTYACNEQEETEYRIVRLKNTLKADENNSAKNKEAFLEQNLPNPFQSQTKINYSIPSYYSSASIEIVSIDNRLVGKFNLIPGEKSFINYDGSSLAAGSYYYILKADGAILDRKKMIVAK